jgi:dTMP kinase
LSHKGRFITLEGGEGVGKSSLLRTLAEDLKAHSIPVITTREPGGTPSADRIRSLFAGQDSSDPWLPETEAFLVSAGRAQHVGRLIRPSLERGIWVLCDRFADSTRVYQGILGGMKDQSLETLINISTQGLSPDCTLILDCDVDVALHRLSREPHLRHDPVTRFDAETRERHEQRRAAYQSLVQKFPDRCHLINGNRPAPEVAQEAFRILRSKFQVELASLHGKG